LISSVTEHLFLGIVSNHSDSSQTGVSATCP
jgi:hypothetical protein